MISVTADTKRLTESLEKAYEQIAKFGADMRTAVYPSGYEMHRLPPDWESRLWSLTHDLAVRMADRCQEGLMTPEEFGKLSHAMAAWTVNTAIESLKPKPLTAEEIDRLLKGIQK